MFCDQTDCGSLFHSVGEATAKPRLLMVFLGRSEKRESRLGEFDSLECNKIIFEQDTGMKWGDKVVFFR